MTSSTSVRNDANLFKKRSRPPTTRKRRRSSFDGESTDERLLRSDDTKAKSTSNASGLQHYPANGSKSNNTEIATASRIDVGGDSITPSKGKKPFGPIRAPAHIRTSVRLDYQADICKDYKETGYCGFGDACKFLHDRSDYKAGWQLEQDWSEKEKLRRERIQNGHDPDEDLSKKNELDDDGLPFACHICRKGFERPVVTLCGHYFCEDCAVGRMEKNATCPVCGRGLSGTLNAAHDIRAKLISQSKS